MQEQVLNSRPGEVSLSDTLTFDCSVQTVPRPKTDKPPIVVLCNLKKKKTKHTSKFCMAGSSVLFTVNKIVRVSCVFTW